MSGMFSRLNGHKDESARLDGVLCGALEQIAATQPADGNWSQDAAAMWDETADLISDMRGDVQQSNPNWLSYRLSQLDQRF